NNRFDFGSDWGGTPLITGSSLDLARSSSDVLTVKEDSLAVKDSASHALPKMVYGDSMVHSYKVLSSFPLGSDGLASKDGLTGLNATVPAPTLADSQNPISKFELGGSTIGFSNSHACHVF
ncbi:hypothetical protein PanWU01x14_123980, partial [Parasponia andersonii]